MYYDIGEYVFPEDEDDHVVGTVLKRFFRDMKAPLLTFDLYDTFIGADGTPFFLFLSLSLSFFLHKILGV